MAAAKIAITLDQELLQLVDELVLQRRYPNRSRAIQEALRDQLQRMTRNRLAQECSKLNPKEEQRLADEGLSGELNTWPEY
jgi:metal-responsive CopG/Arc/MetJ family transcriptional regulator